MKKRIVRVTKKRELTQLTALADRSFHTEEGGMLARWRHCYDLKTSINIAVLEKGRVVSNVGMVPQVLVYGKDRIDSWGITGVMTHKNYRGRGNMSELLQYCCQQMKKNGAAMSDLGGDRQRYNHFGYERAGFRYSFTINNRSLGNLSTKGTADSRYVREYDGEQDLLGLIVGLHESEEIGVKRDKRAYRYFLKRRAYKTIAFTKKGKEAYLTFSMEGGNRRVAEFGGDSRGLGVLLTTVFRDWDTDRIEVIVPVKHRLVPNFRDISSGWSLQVNRMVKIVDLEKTLNGFSNQLHSNLESAGWKDSGSITLKMKSESRGVTVTYSASGARIKRSRCKADVTLDEIGMVNLLFNPPQFLSGVHDKFPVLRFLFPLQYFIWPLESV